MSDVRPAYWTSKESVTLRWTYGQPTDSALSNLYAINWTTQYTSNTVLGETLCYGKELLTLLKDLLIFVTDIWQSYNWKGVELYVHDI
jgi:hypothetical protein